jgi:hypothetical protein
LYYHRLSWGEALLGFGKHYARVFHYVLDKHVRLGRDPTWRASLLIGCAYGVSVVIGLSILRYGIGVEISSFEVTMVAWLVIGLTAGATYMRYGTKTGADMADGLTERGGLALSLSVVALSAIAITGVVVMAAYLLRAT